MKEAKNTFSVLMSVYHKENPDFLNQSLESIYNQSVQADEFILVEDGPLTKKLYEVISNYKKKIKNFKIVKLEKNSGLGIALNEGIKKCSSTYILRADSDDICCKDRFKTQINFAKKNPNVDVFGSSIYEFQNSIKEDLRLKQMPTSKEINKYIIKRNPINHMTACIKRESLIKAGNYLPMLLLEDYYLWVRMYNLNMKIDNIQKPLVYARIGNGFEKRRGNKTQIIGWKKLQSYMLENKIIDKKRYNKNIVNMYVMVFCPTFVRKMAYKFILR